VKEKKEGKLVGDIDVGGFLYEIARMAGKMREQ
jgi:hypothetical protein